MKKIITLILINFILLLKSQEYPLRTFTQIPQNAYLKDINNELQDYEGAWKGTWNNKTFIVTFKKITNQYNKNLKYYKDFLIGKFKVTDFNGQILFDNTNIIDTSAKIRGGKFRKADDKYSFSYLDEDLCGMNGYITINFTDTSKAKLNWQFSDMTDIISADCPYSNSNPFPEPLPQNIILTKQ